MAVLFFHAVISILAVMNPIGILPTFIALTTEHSEFERRHVARKSIINAFVILIVFLLLGNLILQLFSITINAFRVAGGILLFGIAYDLLHAQPSTIQTPREDEEPELETTLPSVEHPDIAMTPLAIPVIAGPGTITTVMALAAGGNTVTRSVFVFLAFSVVLCVTYFIFIYSSAIQRRLRQSQINVITRLMGFLLSIIAIQMAASGLLGLFPGLGRLG